MRGVVRDLRGLRAAADGPGGECQAGPATCFGAGRRFCEATGQCVDAVHAAGRRASPGAGTSDKECLLADEAPRDDDVYRVSAFYLPAAAVQRALVETARPRRDVPRDPRLFRRRPDGGSETRTTRTTSNGIVRLVGR